MIKINDEKYKVFHNYDKKNTIEKYDIKYDKNFYEFQNMIKRIWYKNGRGRNMIKTNMIKISKNSKIW